MGGTIKVESELGKGSTFAFTVQLGRQPLNQEQIFVLPPEIQGSKALVVDDCTDNGLIMQKTLASFGFQVESVFSGEESLIRLQESKGQKEPFRLVLMDWMMPEMDGIETSRIIRQHLKLAFPIILMTPFGKEPEKLDAQKAGISGFLAKPIFPSTLFKVIMDAFEKETLKGTKQQTGLTGIDIQDSISKLDLDIDTFKAILKQFADALGTADPEKIKKHLETVKQHLDSSILQDLEKQINDYDYGEALETLKRIVEKIGSD